MAKQVRLLEAKVGKTSIQGALTSGDRYICIERLLAAAAPEISKEEKRSITKKLAAESENCGGAFRARLSGFDRWFMTRSLIAACLDHECRLLNNATYARFKPTIESRIRILSDMLKIAGKLCSGRRFHRAEGTIAIAIDRTAGAGLTEASIAAAMARAEKVLQDLERDTVKPDDGGTAHPEDCSGDAVSDAGSGEQPCGHGYEPGGVIDLVNTPARLPDEAVLKLNDRLCALGVLLNVGIQQPGHAAALLTVRAAMLQPSRAIRYSEWVSLFGVKPDGAWIDEKARDGFTDRTWHCAEACAGVWDVSGSGPVPAMRVLDLLMNCLTRP